MESVGARSHSSGCDGAGIRRISAKFDAKRLLTTILQGRDLVKILVVGGEAGRDATRGEMTTAFQGVTYRCIIII